MNRSEFNVKVINYLKKDETNQDYNFEELHGDMDLWDEGLVDSFRIMDLIFYLEQTLNAEIKFQHSIIGNFKTINSMAKFLRIRI